AWHIEDTTQRQRRPYPTAADAPARSRIAVGRSTRPLQRRSSTWGDLQGQKEVAECVHSIRHRKRENSTLPT
ncbi:MAG: hypothetical protein ACK56F_31445, partial [bacterium]